MSAAIHASKSSRGSSRSFKYAASAAPAPVPGQVEVSEYNSNEEDDSLVPASTADGAAPDAAGGLQRTTTGGPDSASKSKVLGKNIRNAYDRVCIAAFLATFLMVFEVEVTTHNIIDSNGANGGHINHTDQMRGLKAAITVLVVLQACFYLHYYYLHTKFETQKKGEKVMDDHRWRRWGSLVWDLVICLIHMPFFVDFAFSMETFRTYDDYSGPWPWNATTGKVSIPYHGDMLSMFMVNRVFLLPRLVLYHSSLWSAGSALATLANVEVGVGVAIRAGFAKNPTKYLFFFLMAPFISLSFIFSNCERLVDPIYTQHHHAAWASFVSVSTVGYGTDEAQTQCGRAVSFMMIAVGVTCTAMLISKVQDGMHMTPQQSQVMRMIAEKEKNDQIKVLSAQVIQRVFRHISKVPKDSSKEEYKKRNPINKVSSVTHAIRALARVKSAPLQFDADFETRAEQQLDFLREEVIELREQVAKGQEESTQRILKELAVMQGRMRKDILDEFRRDPNAPRGESKLALLNAVFRFCCFVELLRKS